MSGKDNTGVSRRRLLAAAGAFGVVGLTGCLGGGGSITATGSNTVAPITQEAAESYQDTNDDALVDVSPEGTGAGFSEFCQGRSDIQSASRDITDDEIEDCTANDVEYSRYTVGLDGLAVVKNAENDWVDNITLDELQAIWEFEATDEVTQWSDVRDEWPDEEMSLHARDSASGTFDYFTANVVGERGDIRDDYSATSQTNEIMDAVASETHGFGWGGLGYAEAVIDDGQPLELVPVESDQDGEFYLPTEENVESGLYSPLARPLFFFVNHATLQESPDLIGSYVRHYINNQDSFADAAGFFAAPDEEQNANHDRFTEVLQDLGVEDEVSTEAEYY